MKHLVATLASCALLGCGGVDEPALAEQPTAEATTTSRLDQVSAEGDELDTLPTPEEEAIWAVIGARVADALKLAQDPVEERFFFPVDVTVPPPGLPPPPCPSCR